MSKIIFVTADGQEHIVEAVVGSSVMDAAVDNGVPGIDADCGGAAACGTCHVYVDEQWGEKVGAAIPGLEQDMLGLTDNAADNSRLSCQIIINDELDGLMVKIPESQH